MRTCFGLIKKTSSTPKHIRQITKIEQVLLTKVKHNGHKFSIGFLKYLGRLSLVTLKKILSYNNVRWPRFQHNTVAGVASTAPGH